jgi:hypothetical protein
MHYSRPHPCTSRSNPSSCITSSSLARTTLTPFRTSLRSVHYPRPVTHASTGTSTNALDRRRPPLAEARLHLDDEEAQAQSCAIITSILDQESGLEEHMSTTQVDLGPMTPVGDAQPLPPAITLSTDFLSAHGIATPANTVHPRVPTTGSTDQAETPNEREKTQKARSNLGIDAIRPIANQARRVYAHLNTALKPAQSEEQSTTSSPS